MHSYRAVLFAVVVKLCQFGSFQLSTTNCYSSNTDVGKCVGESFCPKIAQIINMSIDKSCKNDEVCCKMFERIVTPDDAAGTSAFAGPPASSGGAAPSASGVGNGGPPASGAAGGGSGGSPSVGSAGPPTGGSMGPPSGGAPPGGAAPPSGSSPPVVGLYSVAPLSTNITTRDNPPISVDIVVPSRASPPVAMQNSTEVPATTQTQSPSTMVTSNYSSPANNIESTSTTMSSTPAQTTETPKRFTMSILVAALPLNGSSLTPLIRNDTFTINASTRQEAANEINEQLIKINIDPQLDTASDKASQISETLKQFSSPQFERIVVAPDLPQNRNYEDLESVAVSAEYYDREFQTLDQRCDFYYSFGETKSATPASSFRGPVVMIYAGTDSNDNEFPHMAALGYGPPNAIQWLCGGSLITQNFVITAAHCLTTQQLGKVQFVKVGTSHLNQDSSNSQLLNVIQTIPHEEYRPQTQYNDIALLQLDRSVQITEYVVPICLFSSTFYEDKNLIATGWGKTENGLPSTTLQKVALDLFSIQECQTAYQFVSKQQLPLGIVDTIQICAGSRSLNSDTCQGDSGGPLQIRKNNRWYLIGITSAGLKCGVANTPAIYTRVAPYIQWIQRKIGNQ